eukprot:2944709-Prymnesium_polylepis.3
MAPMLELGEYLASQPDSRLYSSLTLLRGVLAGCPAGARSWCRAERPGHDFSVAWTALSYSELRCLNSFGARYVAPSWSEFSIVLSVTLNFLHSESR